MDLENGNDHDDEVWLKEMNEVEDERREMFMEDLQEEIDEDRKWRKKFKEKQMIKAKEITKDLERARGDSGNVKAWEDLVGKEGRIERFKEIRIAEKEDIKEFEAYVDMKRKIENERRELFDEKKDELKERIKGLKIAKALEEEKVEKA